VVVHAGDHTNAVTRVINNNNHPHWNQELWLGCVLPNTPLRFKVMDQDTLDSDDELVENSWDDWASWPQDVTKRLNDTSSHHSTSYHKKYYLKVHYTRGHFTPPPAPVPTPAPGPNNPAVTPPTPTAPTPKAPTPGHNFKTPKPTNAAKPVYGWDDDGGGGKSGKSGKSGKKAKSEAASGGGASTAGVVIGVLAALLACGGLAWWKGRGFIGELLGDGSEAYAPMGGPMGPSTQQSPMHGGAPRMGAMRPGQPPGGSSMSAMPVADFGKTDGLGLNEGAQPGGYQPPQLASSAVAGDDEEEEVSLGAGTTVSASV